MNWLFEDCNQPVSAYTVDSTVPFLSADKDAYYEYYKYWEIHSKLI